MASSLVSPLWVSLVRLLVIAFLCLANWAAMWRLCLNRPRKDGRRQERLLVTSIIVVNLVYVSAVWAPFTLSALRHDLQDLQHARPAPGSLGLAGRVHEAAGHKVERDVSEVADYTIDSDFAVEYIDLRSGKAYRTMEQAVARSPRGTEGRGDRPLPPPSAPFTPTLPATSLPVARNGMPTVTWGSDVQDLVTSTCAYSIAFVAVARLALLRRPNLQPRGAVGVSVGVLVAVGVPGLVTALVRTLGGTYAHFAPHQPELTDSGYFLYTIICDVHITQAYVISLFLEWAALFTVLLLLMALLVGVAARKQQEPEEAEDAASCMEGALSMGLEAWARDVVLLLGALWAWPVKPTLVLVLYCVYGAHWTNVVCLLAHVVVVIPVVFIPLAVFLGSSPCQKSSPATPPSQAPERTTQNMDGSQGSSTVVAEAPKGETARDNLKFYLGTDIFKFGFRGAKKDDRRIILARGWLGSGSSDV